MVAAPSADEIVELMMASRVSTEVSLSRIVSCCLRLTSRVASFAWRSIGS
jgi:hypothetical protein